MQSTRKVPWGQQAEAIVLMELFAGVHFFSGQQSRIKQRQEGSPVICTLAHYIHLSGSLGGLVS